MTPEEFRRQQQAAEDKIKAEKAEQRAKGVKVYNATVWDSARGKRFEADRITQILADAGKTVDDYQTDYADASRYIANEAALQELPAVEKECAKLAAAIEAETERRAESEAREADLRKQLEGFDVKRTKLIAMDVQQIRLCPDRELAAEYSDLRNRLDRRTGIPRKLLDLRNELNELEHKLPVSRASLAERDKRIAGAKHGRIESGNGGSVDVEQAREMRDGFARNLEKMEARAKELQRLISEQESALKTAEKRLPVVRAAMAKLA